MAGRFRIIVLYTEKIIQVPFACLGPSARCLPGCLAAGAREIFLTKFKRYVEFDTKL
jgi:hypothetical protein